MSKMMHDQPSAAVPASRDRRNFLIAGAGLALAATTLGRSGAVMAKPAGQDTPNAPSDAAPVRKETLTTRFRQSPVFHFTLLDQRLHGFRHILDRHIRIGAMLIEKIDVVRFQTL